jgi:hypothetical protein
MIPRFENYGDLDGYGKPLVSNPLPPPLPIEKPHWHTSSDINFVPDGDIESKKPTILLINSANRNTDEDDINGTQSYKVKLGDDLTDIVKLRLEVADIPKSRYMINSYNDIFRFQETNVQVSAGTYFEINLTHGNYDGADLVLELKTEMEVVSATTYDVSYDSDTKKITISQNGSGVDVFNIIFTDGPRTIDDTKYPYFENSAGRIFGFKPINKSGASGASFVGDWIVDLSYGDYVIVRLNDIDNLTTSNASGIGNAWFPVYLDHIEDRYKYINDGKMNTYEIQFKNLKRYSYMRISLFDQYGKKYETNGINHSFVFSVISMRSATLEKSR